MQPVDMGVQPSSVNSNGHTKKFTVLVFAAKIGPVDQPGYIFDSQCLVPLKILDLFSSHQYILSVHKLCGESKLERSSRKLDGLKNEIHSLYYEKGMTQREIARRFGVGEATVSRLFQENEWVSRNERRGVQMRVFENEEERKEARREHRRVTQRRIRELRNSLFGSDCEICGLDTKENKRVLCIHRKDGMEHRINALWRIKYLENLDREDWAPLCIPCHRGTHWLMENANKEWKNLESRKTLAIKSSEETLKPLTQEDYEGEQTDGRDDRYGRTAKEVRRSMFGGSCHFCGK